MNHLIINILISLILPVLSYGMNLNLSSFQPDTIPPPPPGGPVMLSGPSSACTGDTSTYFTEVPVSCTCQWTVNGTLQPENGPVFNMAWELPGNYIVAVVFTCDSGQTTDPNAILTIVTPTPEVFLGNDTILLPGQTLLLDAGNPGCNYLWSTGATSQTLLVGSSGSYSVTVSNNCGTDQDTILVTIIVGINENDPVVPFEIILSERKFIVEGLKENIERIELFDLSGKTLYSGTSLQDVRIPAPGAYLLKIAMPGKIITRKFFSP